VERQDDRPSAAIERLRAEREANPAQPCKMPRKLPLCAISVEPYVFQVREDVRLEGPDPERVKEIAKGLDGSNLDEPIHVWWTGLRWVVIEGHHRHAAYTLRQEQTGKTLQVPIVAHPDISLADAMGLAGRLNNREKVKISKNEMLDNAWRMVCMGDGSIKQQSERSGAAKSTISNMRDVNAKLTNRRFPGSWMIDAGWKQSLELAKGRTRRDHGPEALEAMAHEIAEELKKLKVTTVLKSPEVFARALEILSPSLPERLLASDPFWDALNTIGRAMLEELAMEEEGEGSDEF